MLLQNVLEGPCACELIQFGVGDAIRATRPCWVANHAPQEGVVCGTDGLHLLLCKGPCLWASKEKGWQNVAGVEAYPGAK